MTKYQLEDEKSQESVRLPLGLEPSSSSNFLKRNRGTAELNETGNFIAYSGESLPFIVPLRTQPAFVNDLDT